MRAALLSLVLLCAACASVRVGPEVVGSQNLGYRSPYIGAAVMADARSGDWLAHADGGAYLARKVHDGGWGYRAGALAGRQLSPRFAMLAGARVFGQVTGDYHKADVQPEVEVRYTGRRIQYRLAANGSGSDSARALRASVFAPGQPALRVEVERVWLDHGYRGVGTRVALAALWRIR